MKNSVLVIDDDVAFRGLARRMLADCGLTVVGDAGTTAEGSAAAMRLRPVAGAQSNERTGRGRGAGLERPPGASGSPADAGLIPRRRKGGMPKGGPSATAGAAAIVADVTHRTCWP
jgi:hypothetical protein